MNGTSRKMLTVTTPYLKTNIYLAVRQVYNHE